MVAVGDSPHYDVVTIGSGAGGGTLAHRLAPSGKRVLILERGDYLPRERDNMGVHRRIREGQVPCPGVLAGRARQPIPARGELLRRREHQVLRRRPLPAAARGLRGAAPPRRAVAGLADPLRGPGAVLHRGRAPLQGPRPPRRGPVGGAVERPVRPPSGQARAADPATERRPRKAGPAPVPPAHRRRPVAGRGRTGHQFQRLHPLRPRGRLPLPGARQVGRPGHLRGAGAAAPQRRNDHQRPGGPTGDRPDRTQRQQGGDPR
ncbi:NAD(P)-binding protein [Streptomyces sp. NBC_01278]|uniref:NAD(P)-binding protein n=1 Tax=Streptomyces sp. NBC_01278 TaxID=2903809 RepID=UPI003FCC5A52